MKKFLVSFVLISLCFTHFGPEFCHAQEGESQSGKSIFNVMDFGARGDSPTVDTKEDLEFKINHKPRAPKLRDLKGKFAFLIGPAFSAAWEAACKVNGGLVLVPSGHTFSILPVDFLGSSCQPNVVFQVDGNLSAPSKSDWSGSAKDHWIGFNGSVKGLAIRGAGSLDGNGGSWWNNSPANSGVGIDDQTLEGNRPQMILVTFGKNVTISGITLINSPRMHIFVFSSQQVEINNVTVSSPGNSPNTDGIHVSNTQHVRIHHSNISSGDDCVSIQTGCVDIRVYNVHCNPGHGYSIGGLGDHGSEANVSNVLVTDSTVTGADSLTGVRIKTWPGGSGNVRNVTFSNIQVSQVGRPIVIDQHYNENSAVIDQQCNENSAVAISGVTYENITGTYRSASIILDCDEYRGCRNITIQGVIMLKPIDSGAVVKPNCSHAYGQVLARNTTPPLGGCLSGSNELEVGRQID